MDEDWNILSYRNFVPIVLSINNTICNIIIPYEGITILQTIKGIAQLHMPIHKKVQNRNISSAIYESSAATDVKHPQTMVTPCNWKDFRRNWPFMMRIHSSYREGPPMRRFGICFNVNLKLNWTNTRVAGCKFITLVWR